MSLIGALSTKDVNKFLDCVNTLEPTIGKLGGRRFYEVDPDSKIAHIDQTVSLNDIVVRFNKLYPSLPKDEKTQQKASEILSRINQLDSDANKLHENSNLIIRILTALRSWLGSFKININRKDILTTIEKGFKTVLDPILEAKRLKLENERKKREELARISAMKLEKLISAVPNEYLAITHETTENKDSELNKEEIKHSLTLIGQKINMIVASKDDSQLVSAFAALKDQPERFQLLAQGFAANADYNPRYMCQFLESLEWPSEMVKQQQLPDVLLIALERFESFHFQDTGPLTAAKGEFTPQRIMVNTKKIFGHGDFTQNPKPMSPYLAEAIGHMLTHYAEYCIKEYQENRSKKIGIEIVIGQFVECRFPAAMIAPLLPHLAKVPGIVSLKLSDVGIRNPWDKVTACKKGGFGDADAGPLLNLFRSQPYLHDVIINVDGMSDEVLDKFLKDWAAIDTENKALKEGKSPHEMLIELKVDKK